MMAPRAEEKSFTIIQAKENTFSKRNIKGELYLEILDRARRIAFYQRRNNIKEGIRGFIFHGEVGTGKTTVAKVLARELGVPLIFVDGSDIARPLYGQSENRVVATFDEGKKYRYSVIVVDDCESVFPTRDWAKSETWHIAQNNVFFHCLDNIDTSKVIVILTTNRYDLLDKAIKDRLYNIEFPLPNKETLMEIAEHKCNQLRMNATKVVTSVKEGKFKTVRDLEKFITEQYIEEILRRGRE